jgi:hypothetical protein
MECDSRSQGDQEKPLYRTVVHSVVLALYWGSGVPQYLPSVATRRSPQVDNVLFSCFILFLANAPFSFVSLVVVALIGFSRLCECIVSAITYKLTSTLYTVK